MTRATLWTMLLCAAASTAYAASEDGPADFSGALDTLLVRRQAEARGVGDLSVKTPAAKNALILPDRGDVALIDDGDGVGIPAFLFDLEGKTLSFTPAEGGYRYQVRDGGYDLQAAADGAFLTLGDDDSTQIEVPFAFPYFGREWTSAWVNSDGNVTFSLPDFASTARDPTRMVTMARVAGFFADLDPTQPGAAVRYLAAADRAVFTWINVPEWVSAGGGRLQNFQITLFADGRVELAYESITTDFAIIGIASGERLNESFAVDFTEPNDRVWEAAVVELFSPPDLDLSLIGQKFFLTHGDAYDFLVLFHNYDISLDTNAFAFYRPIRNFVQGIGPFPQGFEAENVVDFGDLLGSAFRLQGFLYMGPLSQYPDDPNERLSRDHGLTLNTPLTVLAHEAGHRFLANTFFIDPATGLFSLEMLGRQLAHWSFFYNSEASLLEGNRIVDHGPSASPFRFETVKTVEGFSALDRYLMGLIPPEDVPPSFLVREPDIAGESFSAARGPLAGIQFDGERVDIPIERVLQAMGRRSPDHTISQRNFRYAFVLLVEEGSEPSEEDIRKIDRFRSEFEDYMEAKTGGGFHIETELVQQLTLNTWPAFGVMEGRELETAVFLRSPAERDLEVKLSAPGGHVRTPESVTIPAGARQASFQLEGVAAGVERLSATIDESFETAHSNIQVRADGANLRAERLLVLEILFGDPRERLRTGQVGQELPYPILVQVVDANGLYYEGVSVRFTPSGDGAVSSEVVETDASGFAQINWTLATERGFNTLTIKPEDGEPLVIEAIGTLDPRRGRNFRRDIFELH